MMDFIFKYFLWVIPLIIIMFLGAFTSWKLNSTNDNTWFVINWILGAIPTWPLIAKYSKHLVFDGILFDVALITTYTFGILYFTRSWDSLKAINYVGLICILAGIYLFKR